MPGLAQLVVSKPNAPYRSGRSKGWIKSKCFNRQEFVIAGDDLFRRLDAMRIPKSPFAKKLSALDARRVRYVRPELVAEVEFRTWTTDGLIRHSTFRGLREDKLGEVALESTAPSNTRNV